jgi:hypothetical protein
LIACDATATTVTSEIGLSSIIEYFGTTCQRQYVG